MGIVGGKPEGGIRISVVRRGDSPPWDYQGNVVTPEAEHTVAACVDAAGAVKVELSTDAPPELAEKVRLILRTVYKQAMDAGSPAPPRKIERWRGEK